MFLLAPAAKQTFRGTSLPFLGFNKKVQYLQSSN